MLTKKQERNAFDRKIGSEPIEYIDMNLEVLKKKSFTDSMEIIVFFKKNSEDKERKFLKSPPLMIYNIILRFALFFPESLFSYCRSTFPNLISPEVEMQRAERKEIDLLVPREFIKKATISDTCHPYKSKCKHNLTLHLHQPINGKLEFPGGILSSKSIVQHFADVLEPYSYLHIRNYLAHPIQWLYASQKLKDIFESKDFSHVSIRRSEKPSGRLGSRYNINGLTIVLKDGSVKDGIPYCGPEELIKFFGIYLDNESFEAEELAYEISRNPHLYALRRIRLAITNERFSHVHFVKDESISSDYKLVFNYKDGCNRELLIPEQLFELFTENFAIHFDEASFNRPEVQIFITDKIKESYLLKLESQSSFPTVQVDSQYYARMLVATEFEQDSERLEIESQYQKETKKIYFNFLQGFFKPATPVVVPHEDDILPWLEDSWSSEKKFLLIPKIEESGKQVKDIEFLGESGSSGRSKKHVCIKYTDHSKEIKRLEVDELYKQFGLYLTEEDFAEGSYYEKLLSDKDTNPEYKVHYVRYVQAYDEAKIEKQKFSVKYGLKPIPARDQEPTLSM